MAAPFDQVHPFIAGVDEVLQQLIAVELADEAARIVIVGDSSRSSDSR